jgi:peptidoglycan/LPS O-acetylase OafA/YrhL
VCRESASRAGPPSHAAPVLESIGVRRHHALDGLRCLAIIGVVWHHSLPRAEPGWIGRGHVGVPLFFALSGFLITTLLLAERRATGDIALGQFWIRRGLRIFPLYYATLSGFTLFLALREPSDATRHFFDSLPFYASYTSNWFVEFRVPHPVWFGFAWSLATEEQFYLWWPTLLRHAERRGRALAPLALMALLAFDQGAERGFLSAWVAPDSTEARMVTSISAAMGFGALLAWAMCQPRAFGVLKRALANRHATVLCAAACAALIWQPLGPPFLLDLALALLVASAASSSCALPPVGASANDLSSRFVRLLSMRPLVYVGKVSYGVYLFHVPVLGSLERACPWLVERPLALFPPAFLLSVLLAGICFRTIEMPLLALKERFRPLPASPSPEPVAAKARSVATG